MHNLRLSTFALFVVALVVTLWTKTSYAYPDGVDTGLIGGATVTDGCNNTSCHGFGAAAVGPIPANVQVRSIAAVFRT